MDSADDAQTIGHIYCTRTTPRNNASVARDVWAEISCFKIRQC